MFLNLEPHDAWGGVGQVVLEILGIHCCKLTVGEARGSWVLAKVGRVRLGKIAASIGRE